MSFVSPPPQDQLLSKDDEPEPASAAVATEDMATAPDAAAAGVDSDVAAEGCPSHAAEVLRPPTVLSPLLPLDTQVCPIRLLLTLILF